MHYFFLRARLGHLLPELICPWRPDIQSKLSSVVRSAQAKKATFRALMNERASPPRRILFAVKDNGSCCRALGYFWEHVAKQDDEIIFFKAVRPCHDVVEEIGYSIFTSVPEPTADLVLDRRIAEGRRLCSALVEKALALGFLGARGSLAINDHPGDAIIRSAYKNRASLIVMGTSKKNFFMQLLNAGISSHVQRGTSVPVLVLPPKNK